MSRRTLTSPTATAVGPYSHGVVVEPGEMVYLSGQTPIDPVTGALVVGDVGTQTRQCFANLFAVLANGAMTEANVVKVNVFLTDMADFDAMNVAYREHFAEPFPARTTVAVAGLPLVASVEIELVARR